MKKSATLGRVTVGEPCEGRDTDGVFEERHIHGMIGISITMGLTRKVRMRKHWSRSPHDDYPLVRQCMPRDLFELLYCRFLHCSDPNAPERLLPDGEENPDYDSKWHIRCLRIPSVCYVELFGMSIWCASRLVRCKGMAGMGRRVRVMPPANRALPLAHAPAVPIVCFISMLTVKFGTCTHDQSRG